MTNENKQTYDFICFTNLAYEFEVSEKKEIENKIKKQLRYYKLGEYNQERVEYIRQLKKDLYSEINMASKSKYFHKSKSIYADLKDFDLERMAIDYNEKYEKLDKNQLIGMLNFAIYLYHLR